MKLVSIEAEKRDVFGRGHSARLRKARKVPAVLYGPSGVRHFTVQTSELIGLFKEIGDSAAIIELKFEGGDVQETLLQDVQKDALGNEYYHVDFKELVRGQEISTSVPVRILGIPNGVKNEGGVLEHNLHEVEVRARPSKLPSFVEVSVEALDAGSSLRLSELPLIEGVTYLDDPETVVASCHVPTIKVPDTPEAGEGDEETAKAEAEA